MKTPKKPATQSIVPPPGIVCPLKVCEGKFSTSTGEPNPELQVQTTTCSVCGAAGSCDVKLAKPTSPQPPAPSNEL